MSDTPPTEAFWFRIGYALERGRQTVSTRARQVGDASDGERRGTSIPIPVAPRLASTERTAPGDASGKDREDREVAASRALRDPFSEVAASWVERRVVTRLLGARRPSYWALGRAALAGAGAELAAVVVRAALRGPPSSEESAESAGLEVLAEGAAEGMVYASLVHPFVPGPTWMKGAVFGAARYFAARGGGLPQVLGSLSPHRQIPGLDSLVVPRTDRPDTWVEHVVAGLVLAALYESSDRSNGTVPDGSD